MPSLSRSEAARRNGAKSKGPVTLEGKARSSQNALKHGLTARNLTLSHEEQAEYQEMLDGLRLELQPVGILEDIALKEYVAAVWAFHRLLRLEPALLDCTIARLRRYSDHKGYDNDTLAALALENKSYAFTDIMRYQKAHSRNADRALARLRELQRHRLAQPKPAPLPEPTLAPAPEPAVQPLPQDAPPPQPAKLQNEPKPNRPTPINTSQNEPDASPDAAPISS